MVTQLVAGRVYDYSHCVGRGAASGMGFNEPVDLALGEGDLVYVLSRGSEFVTNVPWHRTGRSARVSIISIGTEPGDEEFISEFGKYGNGDGEFIWATGLAMDRQQNVYVTDEWLHRVSVFDKDGKYLYRWGTAGQGPGEFSGPSGIVIDPEDNLYIVDSRNHRVQKFQRDGTFLSAWGSFGREKGQFDSPWGITLDREGYLYVADHKNHRVQKLTPDGECVATFGAYGAGRGELCRPSDVAVDPDGDMYICDWANNRVQLFAPNGRFVTSFVGDARELSKWAQMVADASTEVQKRRREVKSLEPEWRFALPRSVTFDARQDRFIVTDTQRSRLQIYKKLKTYAEPQRNL